jgi:hypothetical protein
MMARQRRKSIQAKSYGFKRFYSPILVGFIILATMAVVARNLLDFIKTTEGLITLTTATLALGISFYFKIKETFDNKKQSEHKKLQIEAAIANFQVSHNREDYIIENADYRRGNAKENIYRKMFLLPLLSQFGNKCAKCGSSKNGLDLDHFFISKNEGGCFMMRHHDGYLINNAIPLCQTCNRSKSDKSFQSFFTRDEILRLLQLNADMTKQINQANVLHPDGSIMKTKKEWKSA